VRQFMEQGGTFIIMVGAEEVRPSLTMLDEFQFHIAPSPVNPDEDIREPDPLGAFAISYGRANDPKIDVQFFAAWPMEILTFFNSYIRTEVDGEEAHIVSSVNIGQGRVLVIADTNFAINRNLESLTNVFPSHINFWRVLLTGNTGSDVQIFDNEPIREQGPAGQKNLIPEQGPSSN
jgi:hypothetical protein